MRYLLLIICLALQPVCGSGAKAWEPDLHGFTLENGLNVVVIEDHRSPVAVSMVWYRVGSRDDPPGLAGTAHFLEHLMFKATDEMAAEEFSSVVAENGGTDNAFTTPDQTAYFSRIAADRLDLVMRMEADRMVDLALTPADLQSEGSIIIEERRQVVDGNPSGVFWEQLLARLHGDSPAGRPTIGSEEEIRAQTLERVTAFYRAHYAPNNAILVVAGDVDPEETRQRAEQWFGAVPAAPDEIRRAAAAVPDLRGPLRIEMRDPRVDAPQLTRLYLAPPRRSGDQKPAATLVLLADLLGGGRVTSILSRNLVTADGPALAAGAFYSDTGLDTQSFGISAMSRPGVEPAEMEAALDARIAEFVAQGPDPAEVERIKGRLRAEFIFVRDDLSGRATEVGTALTSGLTLDDVEEWPGVLLSVTTEDIHSAARSVLQLKNSVTGWLLPPIREGAQE